MRRPPLVLHVVHRLEAGGLQNGLVNLINKMPPDRYRHAVLCMADATDFAHRLNGAIEIIELRKRPGKDWPSYARLERVLRRLKPAFMHTRNYGTLDTQVLAAACGVPCRVHGEHGRDVFDIDGTRIKFNLVRRAIRPFVHAYIAVSTDLAAWLSAAIKIPSERVHFIPNGVDSERFSPSAGKVEPDGFSLRGRCLIGTVGRMAAVKNQTLLVDAYVHLIRRRPGLREHLGLVLVGDGPLRVACREKLAAASLMNEAWLPGERDDIPDVLRALEIFVLPSRAEGMSNTILEAMASRLPVIATAVGGNPELVRQAETGLVVPPDDITALADAIEYYVNNPAIAAKHGDAARRTVEQSYSLSRMVESYLRLYDTIRERRLPNEAMGGAE